MCITFLCNLELLCPVRNCNDVQQEGNDNVAAIRSYKIQFNTIDYNTDNGDDDDYNYYYFQFLSYLYYLIYEHAM